MTRRAYQSSPRNIHTVSALQNETRKTHPPSSNHPGGYVWACEIAVRHGLICEVAGPSGSTVLKIWKQANSPGSRLYGLTIDAAIAEYLRAQALIRDRELLGSPGFDLAIASAEGFRAAIDALPVGRDIRNRLLVHLDAQLAELRAMTGAP